MKHHLCAIALTGLALLPLTSVRADEKKPLPLSIPLMGTAPFSPAVPLSRAETKQLEVLTREAEKATTERLDRVRSAHELSSAAMEASPANKAESERKYKVAEAALFRASQNEFAAKNALASFQSAMSLPLEVRPYLPAGARSLYVELHPMDATGQPMLLHLWTTPRLSSFARAQVFGGYDFDPSPFCLDVFKKGEADAPAPGKWTYVTTASFLNQFISTPNTLKVHFLNATSKQGPVVSFEWRAEDTPMFTVITFPKGLVKEPTNETEEPLSYVQNLSGGGPLFKYYDFGVDEHGTMTLLEKNAPAWKAILSEGPGTVVGTLKWNGQKYVPSAAK